MLRFRSLSWLLVSRPQTRQRADYPVAAIHLASSPTKNNQHSQRCKRGRTTVAHSGAAPFVPNEPLDELRGEPG